MIDYHLHTARCCHASGTPQDYLRRAEERGLREIGFADHFPLALLDHRPRVPVTMEPGELEDYISDVENLQGAGGNPVVKLGIEIDYLPGTEEKLSGLLGRYPFDYVIGSIHFMGDWDFTHPVYAAAYAGQDMDRLYTRYFGLVRQACESGLFDIFGHIDVIKKFGYRPSTSLEQIWGETARLLRKNNICVELNTAGRDAPVGDFYPDLEFLKICRAEGVFVTLGSDAHAPEQVGRYMPEALETLQAAGYREIAVFDQRRRSLVPLPPGKGGGRWDHA